LNKTELIELSYLLISYPEVRTYMDEDWFANEAHSAGDEGYFIPSRYLVSTFTKNQDLFPGPINL